MDQKIELCEIANFGGDLISSKYRPSMAATNTDTNTFKL